MSIRSLSSTYRTLVLGLVAALMALAPATAQSSAEREIDAGRERVRALLREARELQELGREERALALRREAEQLEERLQLALARLDRPRPQEGEEILRGLRQGMEALRALGRMDALEQMERITADVERELTARRARQEDESTERRRAEEQLEIVVLATEILADAGREDAADILGRAFRARRVALEGRRDEEAAEIRAAAPRVGNQAELLMLASRILAERGNEERAKVVMEYARQLADQARRIRQAGEQGERPAGGDPDNRARMERIESLEARLRQLQESIQELQAAVRAIRRDR